MSPTLLENFNCVPGLADDADLASFLNLDDMLNDSFLSFESKSSKLPSNRQADTDLANKLPISAETISIEAPLSASPSSEDFSIIQTDHGLYSPSVPVTPPVCVSPSPSTASDKEDSEEKTDTSLVKPVARKRRRSVTNDSSEAATEEQRRARNREHAKRSRLRKKSLTQSLQQSMAELKAENKKLREQLHTIFGKRKTESLVKARSISPTEKFIDALKDPQNRVIDSNTIEFMQSLRKDVSFKNDIVGTIG